MRSPEAGELQMNDGPCVRIGCPQECAACGRSLADTRTERHHDHYVEELLAVAKAFLDRQGALDEFKAFCLSKVATLEDVGRSSKLIAIGPNAACMRFAVPVTVCFVCNGLDVYMKAKTVGGVPRVPELVGMSNFSLTPAEIGHCLAGGDGTQDRYADRSVMETFLKIVREEKSRQWAGRRVTALKSVTRTFDLRMDAWRRTRVGVPATRHEKR